MERLPTFTELRGLDVNNSVGVDMQPWLKMWKDDDPSVQFDVDTPKPGSGDELAATDWDSFKGQERVKRDLDVRIASAAARDVRLDHVLLAGGPGTGKTTVAYIIANQLGKNIVECPTPLDEGDLIQRIKNMKDGDVLFLDEVHQVAQNRGQAEALMPILNTGRSRNGELLPNITIVAATTDRDRLQQPFIDRFPIQPHFDTYTKSEMREIVQAMTDKFSIELPLATVYGIAKACSGVPRLAGHLVRAARDLLAVNGEVALDEILDYCNIRADGLSREHEMVLTSLLQFPRKVGGSMVYQAGVLNVAKIMRVKKETVEKLEVMLIEQGYLELTGGGRRLTDKGIALARELI